MTITMTDESRTLAAPPIGQATSEPGSPSNTETEWLGIAIPPTYQRRCEVRLIREEGQVSVYVPALPGVVSFGQTDEEAITAIKEALIAAVETYQDRGQQVPWQELFQPAAQGERACWIFMDA